LGRRLLRGIDTLCFLEANALIKNREADSEMAVGESSNGIGSKEEAAYQCGPKSAFRGRNDTSMLRHRWDDRLLRSWKVDPHQ
jgi:hypothetical protein